MTFPGSILRGSGDTVDNDNLKLIYIHGAHNLGAIIELRELEIAAVHPGETLDFATGAGGEDNITIGAIGSVHLAGIAEWDPGQIAGCSSDYTITDEIPCLFFHWMPGALMRNIVINAINADLEPGEWLSTTSAAAGALEDDTTTAAVMRSFKFVANAASGLAVAYVAIQSN